MQSRVVIKSPWKDVSGNYKVTGSRDNFSANTLMKWDSDKQIVGDVSFDLTNGVKVEFNAETPFYSKYALYDILFLQDSLVRNKFMFTFFDVNSQHILNVQLVCHLQPRFPVSLSTMGP